MPLRDYLETHGITHKAFADLIGCEQPTVTRFVNGRVPSSDLIRRIVEETNGRVTANDLLGIRNPAEAA